jgi:hypothetical protein
VIAGPATSQNWTRKTQNMAIIHMEDLAKSGYNPDMK